MKHFLDTSVLRHTFHGTLSYKNYLKSELGENKAYISSYVQMEFKRSYLCSLIDFNFVLKMPNIYTIGDAFSLWSDNFKSSELKAVMQLIGTLFDKHQLGKLKPKDKNKALDILSSYIIRVELMLRKRFNDIGSNMTHCSRAAIPFDKKEEIDKETEIRKFNEDFKDVKRCHSRCKINDFIYKRFLTEVKEYSKQLILLSKPSSSENKGFKKIVEILEKGTNIKSCNRACAGIGDAVIALEMPITMRLETLDHSFDHLCPPIKKQHFRHISHSRYMKSQKTSI